jgi:hypothetical protein
MQSGPACAAKGIMVGGGVPQMAGFSDGVRKAA